MGENLMTKIGKKKRELQSVESCDEKIAEVDSGSFVSLNQQILTAVLLPSGSFPPLITVFFSHPQLPFPDPSSPYIPLFSYNTHLSWLVSQIIRISQRC